MKYSGEKQDRQMSTKLERNRTRGACSLPFCRAARRSHSAGRWRQALVVGLLVGGTASGASAATITVDEVSCTLVDAITAANTDTATGGCPAGVDDDTLVLTADVTLTQVVDTTDGQNGLPSVRSTITIEGNGNTIERDPALFSDPADPCSSALGDTFRLVHVGGVGDLTLQDVTLQNGCAAAPGYGGTGGGIFASGDVVVNVTNSTVSGNSANGGEGGGIFAEGGGEVARVNVMNSTVSGNSGGGIFACCDTHVNVTNSTVSGNSGRGIVALENIFMDVTNSTVSGNLGGGLRNWDSSLTVTNTVFAENTDVNGPNNCTGDIFITSLGHNLADDESCNLTEPTDKPGTPADLGPFTDDGTPGGGHFPLLATSPAIDMGDNALCTTDPDLATDQLGQLRVDGDGDGEIICDIGSIEFQVGLLNVKIDIKPRAKRNLINPRARGGIWVAVLSDTDPDSPFDPSSQVDIPTVEFGPDGANAIRSKVKDINRDGLGDLLLRFRLRNTGIQCGDTEATLIGETFDRQSITGTDSIKTVGCRKKHHREHDDDRDRDRDDGDEQHGPRQLHQRRWQRSENTG